MADSHAAPKHDYHLVNPSPWPLLSSIFTVVMMVGAVTWMRGLYGMEAGTKWLFFVGLAGVLVTAGCWWSDVVKESKAGDHTPVVSIGLRYGMVLFIASEIMFFAAFFWMFFEMALFTECPRGHSGSGQQGRDGRRLVDLAAQGRRGAQRLAPAAVEHCHPAAQRLHGDLGAPRVAGR